MVEEDPLDAMEEGQEAGPGWFDEADAELDRFMQEDALLEALQHEPDPCESYRREQADVVAVPMQPFEVEHPASMSSGSTRDTGADSLAARVESAAEVVNESLGLHSRDTGPKGRRTFDNANIGPEGTRLLRQTEASGAASTGTSGSPASRLGPGGRPQRPQQKPTPWGALALFVVAIFSIVYFGLGLFESTEPHDTVAAGRTATAAQKYAQPKPISMPSASGDADDELGAANATVGVNRGRIAVQKSREVAGESSASDNVTSSDEGVQRAERTRMNRLRNKDDEGGGLH